VTVDGFLDESTDKNFDCFMAREKTADVVTHATRDPIGAILSSISLSNRPVAQGLTRTGGRVARHRLIHIMNNLLDLFVAQ